MKHERAARQYGLRYIDDFSVGFTRKPRGRGFSFYDEFGKLIRDRAVRERLKSLAIPPAWQEVWIAPDPVYHIQATGRDLRRRRQYVYHPTWTELQTLNNFARLESFVQALPDLRRQVDRDMRRTLLRREKVVALVVYLLEKTLIRVGNDFYRKQNNTYGLTTLRDRHFERSGNSLHFDFTGKSGVHRQLSLTDARAARAISRCQELPGQQLFQYLDDQGNRTSVDSADVNDYLREHAGEAISAKDFRTWGGTVSAARLFSELEPFSSDADRTRQINGALRQVAERLGNTLAVCRSHYVHPAVLEACRDETLKAIWSNIVGPRARTRNQLSPAERATLKLIR